MATHKRRQLIVVTNEYERIGESKGSQASRQRNLRRFIHDAYVKSSLGKDGSARGARTPCQTPQRAPSRIVQSRLTR